MPYFCILFNFLNWDSAFSPPSLIWKRKDRQVNVLKGPEFWVRNRSPWFVLNHTLISCSVYWYRNIKGRTASFKGTWSTLPPSVPSLFTAAAKCNCLKNITGFPSVTVEWAEPQRLTELKPPRSQWIFVMKKLSNGVINLQGDPRAHTSTVSTNTRTYEISQRVNAPAQCSQQSWL